MREEGRPLDNVDRFKQQRELLLEPGESALLEATARLKLGQWRLQGIGRAFLTNRRLIWLLMAPRPVFWLFTWWLPSSWYSPRVEIRIDDMQSFHVQFQGEVLMVSTLDERYEFRLAEGYWTLINPFAVSKHRNAAKEWRQRLQGLTPATHE